MLNILVSTVIKYISQYILNYIKRNSNSLIISKITVIFNSQKICRKLHLSKVKHSKFNESGQLLIFYLMSVLWAGDVIFRYVLGIDVQSVFLLSPSTAPVTEVYPIESLHLQGSWSLFSLKFSLLYVMMKNILKCISLLSRPQTFWIFLTYSVKC